MRARAVPELPQIWTIAVPRKVSFSEKLFEPRQLSMLDYLATLKSFNPLRLANASGQITKPTRFDPILSA